MRAGGLWVLVCWKLISSKDYILHDDSNTTMGLIFQYYDRINLPDFVFHCLFCSPTGRVRNVRARWREAHRKKNSVRRGRNASMCDHYPDFRCVVIECAGKALGTAGRRLVL
jgi:hypothetical protein